MSNSILEQGSTVLAFSRRALLGISEDIPADKLTYQPFPGANHALWIQGHLASTDDYFLTALGRRKSELPAAWGALFGMGSSPAADARKYPALSEVRDALARCRESLLGWFRSLSASQLDAALPDDLKGFAPNHVGLMFSLAWHEGLHTGQLSAIRKSLGLKPKFG